MVGFAVKTVGDEQPDLFVEYNTYKIEDGKVKVWESGVRQEPDSVYNWDNVSGIHRLDDDEMDVALDAVQ